MFFAIVLSAIIGRVMQDSKSNIYKMWTLFFVGTFLHELSHFLTSLVTLGFPYKLSVIPKKDKDNPEMITMGHVKSFNVRWYNVFWISMSPLLLLPMAMLVNEYFFLYFESSILNFFTWVFLMISMVFSAVPSRVDFSNLIRGNIFLNMVGILVFPIIYFILYYIGVFNWFHLMIINLMK